MGTFANNLLVYGADFESVKDYYESVGHPAYLSLLDAQAVMVAEGLAEERESEAETLSRRLSCVVFVCDIIDSDALIVDLLQNGEHVDFYVSNEALLEEMSMGAESPTSMPMTSSERARLWCGCLGKPDGEQSLTEVLAAPDPEQYVFAEDYQAALWQAMGLPTGAIGVDYRFLEQGEVPTGLKTAIERVG